MVASQECQDHQGRWYAYAIELTRQTGYNQALWALRPDGSYEYVKFCIAITDISFT